MSDATNFSLACLCCGKPLNSAIPGLNDLPLKATVFVSHGNYGSTVFDPFDGSFLQVNVCDDCLRTGQAQGRVLFSPRAPASPPPVLTLWDGAEPDEGPPNLEALLDPEDPTLANVSPSAHLIDADASAHDLEAKIIRAPWSHDQVASLNGFQASGFFHPFTCDRGSHTLRATASGWVCPQDDYTQDWAHDFMLDGSWRDLTPS
jgi:hypothetical protein